MNSGKMKIIFYILGVILIIASFLIFSSIGVFNNYIWMNFTYHIIIVLTGFIVLSLGIISMIMFTREKKA
jgi:hypothetical protein